MLGVKLVNSELDEFNVKLFGPLHIKDKAFGALAISEALSPSHTVILGITEIFGTGMTFKGIKLEVVQDTVPIEKMAFTE